jgi:hypothetical protein
MMLPMISAVAVVRPNPAVAAESPPALAAVDAAVAAGVTCATA